MATKSQHTKAFTLVELLAVAVLIVVLAGLCLRVVYYVKRSVTISSAKAQLAAMCAALEMYKADQGYYPATTPARISGNGSKESTNNWYLYRALTGTCGGCRKIYIHFPAGQINVTMSTALTNILDPVGKPWNYYNSPTTTYALSNNASPSTNQGYTVGGQVNVTTYDLFSYGFDGFTSVPGANNGGGQFGSWYPQSGWFATNPAADDISNWSH